MWRSRNSVHQHWSGKRETFSSYRDAYILHSVLFWTSESTILLKNMRLPLFASRRMVEHATRFVLLLFLFESAIHVSDCRCACVWETLGVWVLRFRKFFSTYFGSFILVPVLVLEFPVQYPTFIIANTGFRLSHNCMVALHKPNLSKANEISSQYGIKWEKESLRRSKVEHKGQSSSRNMHDMLGNCLLEKLYFSYRTSVAIKNRQ